MFQTNIVEKIETDTMYSVTSIFFKSYRLWHNVEKKNCRAGQATCENMAHAHCMLDK